MGGNWSSVVSPFTREDPPPSFECGRMHCTGRERNHNYDTIQHSPTNYNSTVSSVYIHTHTRTTNKEFVVSTIF